MNLLSSLIKPSSICGAVALAGNLMAFSMLDDLRYSRPRLRGPATVLAVGTANPSYCVMQSDFPDLYFHHTKTDHKTELKKKFKRICEKSMIKKRYLHMTPEILKQNPSIAESKAPSLNARQKITNLEVPLLGKEAAAKAIKEWGQPKSKITHLIFCTVSSVELPGADYQLTKVLGLSPSVNRTMIYQQGCFAGGTALRLAKDFAENNAGARVLVVCSEIMLFGFHGPDEDNVNDLLNSALFGDGASAAVIGADPDLSTERPLFEIIFAGQTIVPASEGAIVGQVFETGLESTVGEDVPRLVSNNIEKLLKEVFYPVEISDWNSLFWILHPGGPAILNQIEMKLGLRQDKLKASRHVLSEFGNMSSASVLFVMDEMRKRSLEEGMSTTGEGLECGVLLGIGPGITVETVLLRGSVISA